MSSTHMEKNTLRSRITGVHEKSQLDSFSGSHPQQPTIYAFSCLVSQCFHLWSSPKDKGSITQRLKETCLGRIFVSESRLAAEQHTYTHKG